VSYDNSGAITEDAIATFAEGASLFDDDTIARFDAGVDYTCTVLQHDRTGYTLAGDVICWGNQDGETFRSYEHGLFVGTQYGADTALSGCHLANDAVFVWAR